MRRFSVLAFAVGLMAFAPSAPASATTLVVDGGWQTFAFACPGIPPHVNACPGTVPTDLLTGDSVYSFSISAPTLLRVTNVGFSSNVIYAIYNGETLIGQTIPGDRNADIPDLADILDPEIDYNNAYYSHVAKMLDPGTYSLSFAETSTDEYTSGRGAVSLVSVSGVPEPTTWMMAIIGIGLSGAVLRRRRPNSVVRASAGQIAMAVDL